MSLANALTLEDSMLAVASAIIVAALIISISVLSRLRLLAAKAAESTDLAEDLWRSLETRLRKQDERIVDLIARVEITEVRSEMRKSRSISNSKESGLDTLQPLKPDIRDADPRDITSNTVERRILEKLVEGPKTSTEIKLIISKSREHTSRLLKSMFDGGRVIRNDSKRPFVYEITDLGRRYLEDSLSADK